MADALPLGLNHRLTICCRFKRAVPVLNRLPKPSATFTHRDVSFSSDHLSHVAVHEHQERFSSLSPSCHRLKFEGGLDHAAPSLLLTLPNLLFNSISSLARTTTHVVDEAGHSIHLVQK